MVSGSGKVKTTAVTVCWGDYWDFIDNCIESLEKQTTPYKHIVVNNGDKPKTVIGATVINLPHKVSFSAALNKGFEAVKTEYCFKLDADDTLESTYIEYSEKALKDSDIARPSLNMFGDKTGKGYTLCDVAEIEEHNAIYGSAVFKKSVWDVLGGFDEQMSTWEDWDFWIRAVKKGFKVADCFEAIFNYNVREDSMYHSLNDADEMREYMREKYEHA